jgi:membrane fusion protein
MDSLFRKEVQDARRGEWLGPIRLAMPLSYRVLAFCSLAAAAALVAFLAFGRYTRHERVQGELAPAAGLLTVAAASAGTVVRTWVREGEAVAQDQALVEISTDLDSVSLGKTRAAISAELGAQRRRAESALADQERLTVQKAEGLRSRIAILRSQLRQIDAQRAIQAEQAESARELWQKLLPLQARGVVAGLQIEQQKSAALSAKAEWLALGRQRSDAEQQLNAQEDQLRQLPLAAEAERIELQRKLADLDQALAQNEGQRAIVLRASQAGIVSSLVVKDGQAVAAGQRLLSLVPQGSPLQAELWLPSRAIGFIAPGDRVVLRYQAFPHQKFGHHLGEVAEVSRSALTAAELSQLLGRTIDEPLYRVVVRLDRQSILAYGKEEPLRPGMALEADILLDSRRLIEWAFEPLHGLARPAAAHEPI